MLEQLQSPWLQSGDKLLCLGDSLTAADPGYVQILTETLARKNIQIFNAGVGGDKTPSTLARLESVIKTVNENKINAVSIFLGTNDAAIGHGIWADEPAVSPETYYDNLCWIVHLLKQRCNVKKFSIATPLWRFEGTTYAMHGDILKPYALMARAAADKMQTLLVPMDVVSEHFYQQNIQRRDPETGLLMTTDGTHPTGEVYRLIAETFMKFWQMAE
ncbi:MAG: hypothetical protein E7052_01905 [Lentisphaerae bacterium]|nr:hypothetical protein [Lentisphaerota bacterium]